MNEPVRVLSDLHLGHKVSRITEVSALRPLIAGAATVVFNGDTWQELARPFYAKSKEMLGELRELCRQEGAEPVFLPGNHDPGWPGPAWLELAAGRIVITHGDALFPAGSPWKREILGNAKHVDAIWQEHRRAEVDPIVRFEIARKIARDLCSVEFPSGRVFLQRAWDAVTPPRRAVKMIQAWCTQADAGADFCDRYFPQAEILLIGHFHFAGSWLRGGRRIINTGSFTPPGRAQWVEWSGGFLRHGWVREDPGNFKMAAPIGVWRVQPPAENLLVHEDGIEPPTDPV